ncbi:kinase-like domain-containing protein [Aspergillus oleicola]
MAEFWSINGLCNHLTIRLERLRVRNHEGRPLYPDGTARQFFRLNEGILRQLLRLLIGDFDADILSDLVHRTVRHLSTILAIVLQIRWPDDDRTLRQFLELLTTHQTPADRPRLDDQKLPISLEEAQLHFPQQADNFFDAQFEFCAIVLGGEETVIYQDDFRLQCPLPFRERKIIGRGPYAQVYKVKIERGHIRLPENDNGINEPVWLAQKEFERHQSFQLDRDIMRALMEEAQKHDNLVMALAILHHGEAISIFSPLASCNLHDYLCGMHSMDLLSFPKTLNQKKALYNRGVALAGALAFIHGGFGGAVCFHSDLRPSNVLVYNAYDSCKEIWKITDFGFRLVRNEDYSTYARLGVDGVYVAPESAPPERRVEARSDVWSFGCIFFLVITYMVYGSRGIQQFNEQRAEQPGGDSFYVTTGKSTRISPAVTSWFDELRLNATSDERELKVIRETLDYLQQRALNPNRYQRASAKDVEAALKLIQMNFDPESAPSSPASLEDLKRKEKMLDGFPDSSTRDNTRSQESKGAKTDRAYDRTQNGHQMTPSSPSGPPTTSWVQRVRQRLLKRTTPRREPQQDAKTDSAPIQDSIQGEATIGHPVRQRLVSVRPRITAEDHDSLTSLPEETVSSYSHSFLQTPILAAVEGTATFSASSSNQVFSTGMDESTNPTEWLESTDRDENSTVYSDTMTLPGSMKESYAAELCEQLLLAISSFESRDETFQELCEALPDYLRAFALRFGSSNQPASQAQGDIMTFVHKYRE